MTKSLSKIIFFMAILIFVSCGGNGDNNDASKQENPSNHVDVRPAPAVVYMWIAGSSTGNLGGMDGANSKCQTESSDELFETPVENHRAALSSSIQDMRHLFSNNPPIKRPNGTLIIDHYANFFDPTKPLAAVVRGHTVYQWTGISETGEPSSNHCNNWTSNDSGDFGDRGADDSSDSGRFHVGQPYQCSENLALPCLSY